MFFADEKNQEILQRFYTRKYSRAIADGTLKIRLNASEDIIKLMQTSPAEWDERCQFNISDIGQYFINSISTFNIDDGNQINDIYSKIYRFLCEFESTFNKKSEINPEIATIKKQIESDSANIDENAHLQIKYAQTIMLGHIFKDMIHKELDSQRSELDNQKHRIEELGDILNKYEHKINFVGLYDGFSDLHKQKITEEKKLLYSLRMMGCVIVLPLFAAINLNTLTAPFFDLRNVINILPFISLEIILIYFFRIILLNYRSVKAQIIQIELRKTLCQFIQSYVKYSTENKHKDKDALNKFENLIFSSILPNPENLPSTFDGMEQISKLIKEVRK